MENIMFKKLVKATAIIATGALLLGSLAGCGGGSSSDSKSDKSSSGDKVTLSMAWWGNQVRNERTQKALDKYHEENPSVTVSGQFFQWDDYWSKLATQTAGKKMPDIIQQDFSKINSYVAKKQLLDLQPYIDSGALDTSNISDDIMAMGKVGDGVYGIVAGVNAPCMFYNKTLLDKAGITIKDNMTLDEYIEVAKEVTEKTGYRGLLISSVNGSDLTGAWMRSNDLRFSEDGIPGAAEDYVPFFQILKDGIADGWHISPDKVTDSVSVEQSPLIYGSSADSMTWCLNGTSNMLTAYQEAAPDGVELGITTIPSNDAKKSNYLKPSQFFSISADTKNPDEAVKVLNYLINSSEANEILLGERGIPAPSNIADEIKPKLSETDQKSYTYVSDVVTPNCSPIGYTDPEGGTEIDSNLRKLVEKVSYGEMTPEEAANEYFTMGNKILKGNN